MISRRERLLAHSPILLLHVLTFHNAQSAAGIYISLCGKSSSGFVCFWRIAILAPQKRIINSAAQRHGASICSRTNTRNLHQRYAARTRFNYQVPRARPLFQSETRRPFVFPIFDINSVCRNVYVLQKKNEKLKETSQCKIKNKSVLLYL